MNSQPPRSQPKRAALADLNRAAAAFVIQRREPKQCLHSERLSLRGRLCQRGRKLLAAAAAASEYPPLSLSLCAHWARINKLINQLGGRKLEWALAIWPLGPIVARPAAFREQVRSIKAQRAHSIVRSSVLKQRAASRQDLGGEIIAFRVSPLACLFALAAARATYSGGGGGGDGSSDGSWRRMRRAHLRPIGESRERRGR